MCLWKAVIVIPLAVVLASAGCRQGPGGAGSTGESPSHLSVVCIRQSPGDCDDATDLSFRWAEEAKDRAGSTFSLWVVESTRPPSRAVMACVPQSWGTGVRRAKAAWPQAVRHTVAQALTGQPERVEPADCPRAGSHRVTILEDRRPLDFRISEAVPSESAAPLHEVLVADRSSSLPKEANEGQFVARFFVRWLEASRAAPASSLTLWIVGRSRDTAQRLDPVVVPNGSIGWRVAVVASHLQALEHQLAVRLPGSASAIAEALSAAVEELRDRPGRHALWLWSDGRQITPGGVDFENRRIPTLQQFIEWLRSAGLLSDLRGIPVRGCGWHYRRSGPGAAPWDAGRARQTREVWAGALHAMGAPAVALSTTCDAALLEGRDEEDSAWNGK